MKPNDDFVDRIICGDCTEIMKGISDNSIDLVVTSPPYDNIRTYNDTLVWGVHVWKPIIKDLYRITKDGCVVVWVVADATINGSETGTSFKQALYFKEVGFNLHDTMIYLKPGFTAVGTLCSRYASVFEFMFVFSKGRIATFNPIKDRKNIHSGTKIHGTIRSANGTMKPMSSTGRVCQGHGIRFNIWQYTPETMHKCHPAVFPMQLAVDHIISWSNNGDIVLDPFAGSGTTCLAAKILGRKFIGIEINQDYVDITNERLKQEYLF